MAKEKTAQELAELIHESKLKNNLRAYESLRAKCEAATKQMITDMEGSATVDLEERDFPAITTVTEELRDLGFKFRFIEKVDANDKPVKRQLFISVEHLL